MDKTKHIWIVNYYSTPPKYDTHLRHLKFSEYLQEAGYNVTIFSSGFLRDDNIDLVGNSGKFKKVSYGVHNFVHIKVRHYKGNGLDRMFSIFQFAWRIFYLRKQFDKPDIILHNIHAPFDYPISWCVKKLKAKYLVEAWDLWPESFVTFGLLSAKNPIIKWAYSKERKLYERADKIIFSFEGGLDYLKNKKWTKSTGGKIEESKVNYINNGVSIDEFNSNITLYSLNDNDIESDVIFKIVYLGSIRLVNDVKQLIDAVSLLKKYKDIRLLIYGDGDQREILIQYCNDNSINNVIFKEKRIPLSFVPYVLSHSNINILNYQKGFGKYGISAGKLFQSLASGKPIICNVPIAYDDVITNNNLGLADNLDNPEKYAKAILKIYNMNDEDYESMCERVQDTAKHFDFKILSDNLINVLESR